MLIVWREIHSYLLNESERQLIVMTKAIIGRDYAFITKPCLECGLRPTWDTLTMVWQGGVGDKLISEGLTYNFFSIHE